VTPPPVSADTGHMTHFGSITLKWRPIVFTAAMFWFWYLAPAAVESRALARVILLLQP